MYTVLNGLETCTVANEEHYYTSLLIITLDNNQS
jgi:hypothetical protein